MNIKKNIKKMITTKNVLAIIVLIITTVLLNSCSEDILDKQPLSDISDKNIFNDDVLMEAYVNGTYKTFRFFQFGAFFTEGSTDNAQNTEGQYIRYNRNETTPDNGGFFTQEAWSHNYSYIRKVNLFFLKTENGSNVTPKIFKRLTAEMRFLRAWSYFNLISWYGDVPLVTDVIELGSESFDRSRTPYDEVVTFIVNDLDAAILDLPIEAFNANTGKATRGAAMALKSRVLLYAASSLHNPNNDMSKWQAASDAAETAMNLPEYNIDPDYSNIYNETRSNEVMYGRGYTLENPANFIAWAGWNFVIDRYYLPAGYGYKVDNRFTVLQSLVDAYETKDGNPLNPQDPWNNRDPRLDMTIIHHNSIVNVRGTPTTIEFHVDKNDPTNATLAGPAASIQDTGSRSGYNILKQTDPSKELKTSNPDHFKPWVYFRLAEMYLNYAEAQIELGNDANARTAINVVRSRANVNMPNVTESGNDLRLRYRNERRVELALENHRWYDIIRWKIGDVVLTQPAMGVTILRDNTTIPFTDSYTYDKVLDNLRTWNLSMSYLPIPRSEIEASPSLTQNPGYPK